MSQPGTRRSRWASVLSGHVARTVLGWAIAGAIAFGASPIVAWAQDREADAELESLIPDSALDAPDAWALDGQDLPQGADGTPDTPPVLELPDLTLDDPGMTLAWPDDADLPKIAPLAPDPDIRLAEDSVNGAAQDLAAGVKGGVAGSVEDGVARDWGGWQMSDAPRIADPLLYPVGRQVELALARPIAGTDGGADTGPADALAGQDAFLERFAGLSNLRRLSDDEEENLAQLLRRARTDRDLLLKLLRVHGYYDAEVYQTLRGLGGSGTGLEGDAAGESTGPVDVRKVVVRFDILPGPLYRLRTITLGDLAATQSDYPLLRAAFALQPGAPVNSDRIVEERLHLITALAETGFAYAKVGEPDLLIDHEPRMGDLALPVDPGGKYRFGRVSSSLPRFLSSRHLERIARFDKGDIYRRSRQDDLRQAILATGLVSSVTVVPRRASEPAGDAPGTVDLAVSMVPAPARTIAGLAGYSSGEGFRLEGSWEHRNFFPPEGLVRVRGVLGTREQLVGLTFRRNNFLDRDQVLSLDLYGQTVDRDAYEARTVSLLATYEKQTTLLFQKPWVWSFGLEVVATGEREGEVRGIQAPEKTYFIGALPTRLAFDGSDSLLDPRQGFRAAVRVSPEVSVQSGARSTYLKAQADASYYQPVNDRLVLAGRVRMGTIFGTDIANIAPSRRFYAGGGGSVRGYTYQAIGPRNSLGDPAGGRSLSEFSLEARVRTGLFDGAISLVPFIDAGAVDDTSTPRFRNVKLGAGIGLRYETNFGPLRIDIGTPLNPSPGDSRIGVYVALGQAF